jgi:hypothetical protein
MSPVFSVVTPLVRREPEVSEEYITFIFRAGIKPGKEPPELRLSPASACILLGLIFVPEERGDMLFRNVELPPNYAIIILKTALICMKPVELRLTPASAFILLGLILVPEYRGDMLFRNVGIPHNYTILQSRRPYCSYAPP